MSIVPFFERPPHALPQFNPSFFSSEATARADIGAETARVVSSCNLRPKHSPRGISSSWLLGITASKSYG
jgi:hypothetical protein